MQIERTKNTIRNTIWGFINKLVMLVFPFIIRTVIIYILGINYTGLGSLFNSIISVLSLAEFGVSSAIVYSMYAPIARDDENKICALMKLYRIIYFVIGLFVLVIGICLMPLIPMIIKSDIPSNINIYALYGIYLSNSVASYWLFAYKNCLLDAFQRIDINVKVSTVVNLIMYGLEIALLVAFRDYYYYALCLPVTSILINIITARFVDKMFPQFTPKGVVTRKELKELFFQVAGLLAQKLAFTSRNALDSIIISAYLGLAIVGIYNNYFMVLNSVTALLAILYTAMLAGIGNSIAKETEEKNYQDFRKFNFLYMWISGWATICIYVLVQPFMKLWVGKELVFAESIVFLLSLYFYNMKMTDMVGVYVSTSGIWWKCKYIYIIETISNLVLNIGLGYIWGVYGVIIATIISVLFVDFIGTGIILYKNLFSKYKFGELIKDDLLYFLMTMLVMIILKVIAGVFEIKIKNEMALFAINFVLCIFIPNILFYLVLSKTSIGKNAISWIMTRILKRESKLDILSD